MPDAEDTFLDSCPTWTLRAAKIILEKEGVMACKN